MRRRYAAIRRVIEFLRRSDWQILPPVCALLCFGWLMQWSVSGGESYPFGHSVRIAALCITFVAAAACPAKKWRDWAFVLYGLLTVLLILVLISGRETNNARRWIDVVGGVKFQPSEYMKISLILFLAKWFADRPRVNELKDIRIPCAIVFVPMILILAGPDLGTALSLLPPFLGMVWLAGMPMKRFKWIVVVPLACAPLALLNLKDYQIERMKTWWNQDVLTLEEKADSGYHLWHAKMAIGSGGLSGHGWAQGPENRLNRLPERHNDFIFPVIAEEYGLLGSILFLFLYSLVPIIALWAAGRYRDPFTRLFIAGIGLHFATHLVINVGVATGVWPTTGLPLPMISFGGSSMVVSGLALGILLAVGANPGPVFSSRAFED